MVFFIRPGNKLLTMYMIHFQSLIQNFPFLSAYVRYKLHDGVTVFYNGKNDSLVILRLLN